MVTNVVRHRPAVLRPVHGRVQAVERLETVENVRVLVQQFAEVCRPRLMVRENEQQSSRSSRLKPRGNPGQSL